MSDTLNEGHWHEAMDRSYMLTNIIEIMLLDHPAIEKTEELRRKVVYAQELISEVYQACGNELSTQS